MSALWGSFSWGQDYAAREREISMDGRDVWYYAAVLIVLYMMYNNVCFGISSGTSCGTLERPINCTPLPTEYCTLLFLADAGK